MDFGKVDNNEFGSIDFTLPQDAEETGRILQAHKQPGKKTELYVGCAKWGRKDWIGTIYPDGTKEEDFLSLYARQFNCIELNATFYKLPSVKQVEAWRSKVGKDFKFCPKFNDKITHKKRLKDAGRYTEIFLEGVAAFGSNLGPVFLQTPPNYATKNFEVLQEYLEALPAGLDLFVELRHPGWFGDDEVRRKVFALLEKHRAGAVITDAAGRRDCVHMRLTTPSAFIRFVGNSLHPTDYQRCDEWVKRIGLWVENGIERVYFLMHQQEEVYSPRLCRYFIQQSNQHGFASLPEPQFVGE
ncbi:MAG TPA: DUF72 domain-containing protein [Cyclobacteriaceae bacterium]